MGGSDPAAERDHTCYRLLSGLSGSLVRVAPRAAAPRLAGRAALGRREEVLERDVQEGAVGLGEQLVAVAQLGRDLDPPAAVGGHPRRDPQRRG